MRTARSTTPSSETPDKPRTARSRIGRSSPRRRRRSSSRSRGSAPATTARARAPSGRPPEQAGRPDQQYDRHDDEDYGVGGFRIEHFSQSLDDAERKAGEDRAGDRTPD